VTIKNKQEQVKEQNTLLMNDDASTHNRQWSIWQC